MRLCLISGEYPPMEGGIADYAQQLGRCLAARGAEVHILTSTSAVPQRTEGLVTVHPVVQGWGFSCWGQLSGLSRSLKADLLHVHYQAAAYHLHPAICLFPLWLQRLAQRPAVVTTFHDLRVPYLFPKAGPLRRWLVALLARTSDAVIVTEGQDQARLLVRGVANEGVTAVPLGSSIPKVPLAEGEGEALRAALGFAPDQVVLGFFGFMNHSKGVEDLLEAFAWARCQRPALRLLLVGATAGASDPTNRAYLAAMKELVTHLKLDDAVRWTGYVSPERASALLQLCAGCVLPFRDGASLRRSTLITALVHGLPTITTIPEAFAEAKGASFFPLLQDGANCLLVPPRSPQALGEAMVRLVTDPSLRQELAKGAHRLAPYFSWEQITEKTFAVYQKVLKRRAR